MSLWESSNKSKYKQPSYGFRLGAFTIKVAEKLAELRQGVFAWEYEEALFTARSYMRSLIAAIPDEVLKRHSMDAKTLIRKVTSMDEHELIETYHTIVNILDAEGLLIPKKSGQPREISPIDEDEEE